MQSLLRLNLQPLILILVFCISSVFLSYTDLDSSRLLHSVTASDLTNLRISEFLYRIIPYSDMPRQLRQRKPSARMDFFVAHGFHEGDNAMPIEVESVAANIPDGSENIVDMPHQLRQ